MDEEPIKFDADLSARKKSPWLTVFIIAVLVVLAFFAWQWVTKPLHEQRDAQPAIPASQTSQTASKPANASNTPAAIDRNTVDDRDEKPLAPLQGGDEARQLIATFSADGIEAKDAAERSLQIAQRLRQQGKSADAYLLYFFAARNGNADAAFELANAADPSHHNGNESLLALPDAAQANKWYAAAAELGHPDAQQRIEALRASVEKAAERGDVQAQRLRLQWR